MQTFHVFKGEHGDFIHDVAYDYCGKRLATCSSDNSIKVWDQAPEGEWKISSVISKAHMGAVYKLSWAHPEFGNLLASCSSDRVVNIYEEISDGTRNIAAWKKKSSLVDSRDSVEDIEFAPRHLGLKLATCSLDGRVRIYECNDVLSLSVWPLTEEFEAAKRDCFCLGWNSSPFDPPMLVVGSKNTARVWEFHEKFQRWVVSADLPGHRDDVPDVAWAPAMGRSYHLIATACKDHVVRIFKFWPRGNPYKAAAESKADGAEAASAQAEVELVAALSGHDAPLWRVSWNITGTILASTGDDGAARLWKSDLQGKWYPVLVASGRGLAEAEGPASEGAAPGPAEGGSQQ